MLCKNVTKRKPTRKLVNFDLTEKQKYEDAVGERGVQDGGDANMFAVSLSVALRSCTVP